MAKKATTKSKKPVKLEISVPEKTANVEILKAVISGKATLIKHAFCIKD